MIVTKEKVLATYNTALALAPELGQEVAAAAAAQALGLTPEAVAEVVNEAAQQ